MIYDEEWERKRQERVKRLKERVSKWFNVDNIIDATVDLFLILFLSLIHISEPTRPY